MCLKVNSVECYSHQKSNSFFTSKPFAEYRMFRKAV